MKIWMRTKQRQRSNAPWSSWEEVTEAFQDKFIPSDYFYYELTTTDPYALKPGYYRLVDDGVEHGEVYWMDGNASEAKFNPADWEPVEVTRKEV